MRKQREPQRSKKKVTHRRTTANFQTETYTEPFIGKKLPRSIPEAERGRGRAARSRRERAAR